ncbi:hypothetical protein LguiA_029376 [Lonicera macranthoides]
MGSCYVNVKDHDGFDGNIVGTGGDGANTVNVSTGTSILAAACRAKVAKQGNRSSSSAWGSADVNWGKVLGTPTAISGAMAGAMAVVVAAAAV